MLHVATYEDEEELVQWLLDRGADTEVRDGDGRTPLFYVQRDKVLSDSSTSSSSSESDDDDNERSIVTVPSDDDEFTPVKWELEPRKLFIRAVESVLDEVYKVTVRRVARLGYVDT